MVKHGQSSGLNFNALDGSGEIFQEVRWVVFCRNADA